MGRVVGLALALGLFTVPVAGQDTCPAPVGRLVTVPSGLRVEVVEWSRAGEPLVFLSGMGGTAHAFDDFAPVFADRYRVVGITRRGWGRSSPSPGYDYTSGALLTDIIAVLDSLAIPAAHVAGWSFGGHEATLLAVRYPERVLSLTLLDSYDNSPSAGTFAGSDSLEPPRRPRPPGSVSSLREMLALDRLRGGREPVTELCATWRFGKDGRYLGPVASDSVGGYTVLEAERLAYSAVEAPVLAIYSTMRGVEDMYPDLAGMDSAEKAEASLLAGAVKREMDAARGRLRRALPSARVIEIPGADHAVFRSHPERVIREMRRWLAEHRAARWERS
ncbi:MAG TPA: alpha/beta hydrolase [Gemmatimonadales bacterium]|nr:alpha/beta hydrolase [Gemmatimonadales bacterium]